MKAFDLCSNMLVICLDILTLYDRHIKKSENIKAYNQHIRILLIEVQ